MSSIRRCLLGSWLRVITTAIVVTNCTLITLAFAFLIFAGRETLFRVDAVSDLVTFVTSADLEWGPAPIRAREGDRPLCTNGGVKLPAGTTVTATRLEDGVSIGLDAPAHNHPILVKCGPGDSRSVSFVELWFARPPFRIVNDTKPLTSQAHAAGLQGLSQNEPPRAAVVIAGHLLRVGGEGDPNSPVANTPLLRSGTLSSETASWPIHSSAVVVDRALQPGDIVSFDQPTKGDGRGPQATADSSPGFTGLLLLEDTNLRIIVRTEAQTALLTSPNARAGKPAIVAPTILARLQAQAEWGVFLLIGGLMLSILGALRALVLEEEQMFKWVRPPAKKSRAVKGMAVAIVLAGLLLVPGRPATAQAVNDHPVFRIEVKGGGFGQGFAIQNPRGTPDCLIVTAAHVVRPGDDIRLVGELSSSAGGQAAPIVASARYLDALAPGLIVLEPVSGTKIGPCAPIPQLARSDDLFETDGFGRLTYAEADGERRTIKVVIDGNPRLPDRLLATGLTSAQISPGISGSPLSINGKILAVANSVANGTAELIRHDTATINPRYIGVAPVAAAKWTPAFDVSGLPQAYANVSIEARALATQAFNVSNAAVQNETRATAAVQYAHDSVFGYGTAVLDDKDRVFEGKIDADNVPNGWGILRFTDGPWVGDEVRGLFRREGTKFALSGVGVMTYANPTKHNGEVRMEASFNPDAMGPGLLHFSNGDLVWASWAKGEVVSVETYKLGFDKSAFEVGVENNRFDGPGIHWTSAGQPLCICVWKAGKVIKDDTKKYIAGRQS